MNNPAHTLQLLQARARLRELLPILPANESGITPFCYPALEGFLFALHIAPFEIDMDTWGYFLDTHLPDNCYESEGYRDDILLVYDDMEAALEEGFYFKTHTLSIPPSLPEDEFPRHPLGHWKSGFLRGFSLVESEMKGFPKKLRNNQAFRKMNEDYVTLVLKLLVILSLKIKNDGRPSDQEVDPLLEELCLTKSLDKTFTFVLENLYKTSQVAGDRLDRLL